VASTKLATCAPEDDVLTTLATMKQARVRRLPVLGFGGTVMGILSMNDILRAAAMGKGVSNDDVVEALQAICSHHHPVPHVVAA
jgi:CBS domain-containing protein